jgi:hypothetical protein
MIVIIIKFKCIIFLFKFKYCYYHIIFYNFSFYYIKILNKIFYTHFIIIGLLYLNSFEYILVINKFDKKNKCIKNGHEILRLYTIFELNGLNCYIQ